MSEDKVKGNIIRPDTINPYIYCLSNPLKYVDRDGQKLFGLEHTYTAEESYEYTPKTPWWSPVIFSNTSSVEEEVYSEGEQGSIFTAYYHESSEKESSSVGFDLASIINVDISLEKATLSVRLCEGLYVNLNLGLEETGLTVTREKDDVEEEFGIVIKIFDGNTYHFSLVGSYSVSETKDNTTKTNTTDFGLSLWFAVGLGWILSNLISGNVPDITQMPQYPLPQPASCSL